MILEAAMLTVKPGKEREFQRVFAKASPIIAACEGCLSHELHRCLEARGKYLLLVRWRSVEDHVVGFRQSAAYQEWKRLLHHFYEPFPTVEHFTQVY